MLDAMAVSCLLTLLPGRTDLLLHAGRAEHAEGLPEQHRDHGPDCDAGVGQSQQEGGHSLDFLSTPHSHSLSTPTTTTHIHTHTHTHTHTHPALVMIVMRKSGSCSKKVGRLSSG